MVVPVKVYEENYINEFSATGAPEFRQHPPPEIQVSINFDEIILGLGFSFSYPQFLLALDSYPIVGY